MTYDRVITPVPDDEDQWTWGWVGWWAGVLLLTALAAVIAFFIEFGDSVCATSVSSAQGLARRGTHHLLIACLVLAIPWSVAFAVSRRFVGRWVFAWLLTCIPLAYVLLTHQSDHDWLGGLCF